MMRLAALVVAAVLAAGAFARDAIDVDFDTFFRAGTPGAAEKAANRLPHHVI